MEESWHHGLKVSHTALFTYCAIRYWLLTNLYDAGALLLTCTADVGSQTDEVPSNKQVMTCQLEWVQSTLKVFMAQNDQTVTKEDGKYFCCYMINLDIWAI